MSAGQRMNRLLLNPTNMDLTNCRRKYLEDQYMNVAGLPIRDFYA